MFVLIHKGLIELMGYAQIIGDYSVVPVRIDANETDCEVEFIIYDKEKRKNKVVRKGKHENFVFLTSFKNIPFTIKLESGVIKKYRKKVIK